MTQLDQDHNYTPLAKPVRITEQQWPKRTVPLLSIICITYNHVNFIRDAIEAFLMQETTFPVEILIHDDASEDGTIEVIYEYEAQHPELINSICQSENQYSQGLKPFQFLFPKVSGQFITICEGDDFWQDVEKIQRQVEYLSLNPQAVGVIHNIHACNLTDASLAKPMEFVPDHYKRNFNRVDLLDSWTFTGLQSLLFRNIFSNIDIDMFLDETRPALLDDVCVFSLLGMFGELHYISGIEPSIYRKHAGGVFSQKNKIDKLDVKEITFFCLYRYYKKIGWNKTAHVYRVRMVEVGLRGIGWLDLFKLFLIKLGLVNTYKTLRRKCEEEI